jgi:hypothetical protein
MRDNKIDEGPHLRRRMTVWQEDRIDAAKLDRRLIQRERHQRAAAQTVGNDKSRLVNDTLAGDRRGEECVAIVGPQVTGNLDRDLGVRAECPSADTSQARQGVAETIVIRQFGHSARPRRPQCGKARFGGRSNSNR